MWKVQLRFGTLMFLNCQHYHNKPSRLYKYYCHSLYTWRITAMSMQVFLSHTAPQDTTSQFMAWHNNHLSCCTYVPLRPYGKEKNTNAASETTAAKSGQFATCCWQYYFRKKMDHCHRRTAIHSTHFSKPMKRLSIYKLIHTLDLWNRHSCLACTLHKLVQIKS